MKIKFRVWDKRNNRMIMPRKFATIIPVLDFNGNLGVMDTYKNWHWHGIVPEDEYELMLFIGSHDKNGKEIYEADIVLYDRNIHKDIDTAKFKVVWAKDRYVLQEIKHKYYIDDVTWELVEVVGNIYENPELLKEIGGELMQELKEKLRQAEQNFNYVDQEYIDAAIYELKAVNEKFRAMLREKKKERRERSEQTSRLPNKQSKNSICNGK